MEAQMGVTKIFLRCVGADLDLIMNLERFAWMDLDQSRFDYECNRYIHDNTKPVTSTYPC